MFLFLEDYKRYTFLRIAFNTQMRYATDGKYIFLKRGFVILFPVPVSYCCPFVFPYDRKYYITVHLGVKMIFIQVQAMDQATLVRHQRKKLKKWSIRFRRLYLPRSPWKMTQCYFQWDISLRSWFLSVRLKGTIAGSVLSHCIYYFLKV